MTAMPVCSVASVVSDSATLWTVAHQAPLSMGFSRQGHWSGWPCPSPGDLSDPGMEPSSPAWQANKFLTAESPGKPTTIIQTVKAHHEKDLDASSLGVGNIFVSCMNFS